MNKTVPWSIKGIGSDTREAAKEAARRSGLSLGEWLDGIIAERAAKLGVPMGEIDNRQRLDAVADELSRLSSQSPDSANAGEREAGPDNVLPSPPARDNRAAPFARSRFAGSATEGLDSRGASSFGSQTFDATSSPVEQASFGSQDSAPNVLQAAQGRGNLDPRVLSAVQGSLAKRLDFEEDELRPTQKALRALSERLENFERQNWAAGVSERRLADPITGRARKPGSAINYVKERSIRYAVAEITRRQAALYEQDPVSNPAPSATASSAPVPNGDERSPMGGAEQTAGGADPVGRPADLGASGQPSSGSDVGPGDADPMALFEALGRDLRQAIDTEREPGAPRLGNEPERTGDAAEEVQDSAKDARSSGPRKRREVRDRATTGTEPLEMGRAQGQIVGTQDSEPPEGGRNTELVEAQTTLGEIRALLDRFEPGSAISSLERRMEDLAAKIDRGMEPRSSSKQIEDLARQIDAIHSSIQGQAESQPIAPSSVDALVRGIVERIDEAREASADIQRLESLISNLATKIDNSSQPNPSAVNGLAAQMSRLGEHLERSEASLSALDGVEHSLCELFTQLEETRHSAIDAAENAARTAARDTLRAAMQSPAVPHAAGDAEGGTIGQVTHELAELRITHDASSRRTQATLMGLNQTMEKLVEHLARLEVPTPAGNSAPEAGDFRRIAAAPLVRAEPGPQDRLRTNDAERLPTDPIDPIDTLIEPGLGRASVRERSAKGETGTAAGELDGPASFIAAARRAANAAQVSAATAHKPTGRVRVSGESKSATAFSALERARAFLVQRRRPLLLGLAGLVLLLGALEVAKLSVSGTIAPEHTGAAEAIEPAPAETARANTGADVVPKAAVGGVDARQASSAGEGSSAAPSNAAAAPGSDVAPVPRTVKTTAALPNMNPFLPGSDFKLGVLSEGLRTVALAGDPAAQYEVGLRFAEGRSVDRDVKTAAAWFAKAAAQGLAPAQYRLGSAYEKGIGQPKDAAMALQWYGRAAEAGNMRAMHNLAVMAAEGSVGKPDYAKAASWFEKAAELGVRDSQFNLAILYARGLGIEQSLEKSYTWFAIAASQGDEDAGKKRDEVGARLDAKAIAAAKAAAQAFRPGTAVSAANEVAPPPGGWDAATPSRSAPSAAKSTPPRFTLM